MRRRDPGWGTVAEAREATAATFYYTNAAPQAAGFNQSKELWLGLEDHVLQYAETTDQHISVFTAPVLAPDDPPYRGIRVPRRFWKVAAWSPAPGVLASAGFLLDQSDLIDTPERAVAAARRFPHLPGADRRHRACRGRGPRPARGGGRPGDGDGAPRGVEAAGRAVGHRAALSAYSPARPPSRCPNERPSPR